MLEHLKVLSSALPKYTKIPRYQHQTSSIFWGNSASSIFGSGSCL